MSRYAWAITQEYDEESGQFEESGHPIVFGPREITDDQKLLLRAHGGKFFELRDDDDTPCARGFLLASKEADGFEPLDDYGEGNYGATSIWYQNVQGTWEML